MLLTISRLPNEYIISLIPQYRNTNKTQKKNHQIRSHFLTFSRLPNNRNINKHRNTNIPVKYRNTNIFWVRRGAAIAQSTMPIAIGAVLYAISADDLSDLGGRSRRSKLWTISARSAFLVVRSKLWTISLFLWLSSFFLWVCLSLLRVEGNGLKVK